MHGVRVHAVDQAVEHGHGVVDDHLVAGVGAVQQPAGELQLGVEHGALGDSRVVALACGGVRRNGRFTGRAAGRKQPIQVAGRVAHTERRPAENARDGILTDQERIGRHRPVHHAGCELPERIVVRGQLPPAKQSRGKVAGRRGAVNKFDRGCAALLGALLGETGIADERRRQTVDRGNGTTDRAGNAHVAGQGVRVEGIAGQQLIDDRAGAAERRLADELGHVERQPAAGAGCERAQRHEIGGLLGLGGLAGRDADDQLAAVTVHEQGRVEGTVGAGGERAGPVQPGLDHVEARDGGGGQRG